MVWIVYSINNSWIENVYVRKELYNNITLCGSGYEYGDVLGGSK